MLKKTDFKSEIQSPKKKLILNSKSFQTNDLKSKIRILKNLDFKSGWILILSKPDTQYV